jgi:hypothetical protein
MVPDNPVIPNQETEPQRELSDLCNSCDQQLACASAYVRCAWIPGVGQVEAEPEVEPPNHAA